MFSLLDFLLSAAKRLLCHKHWQRKQQHTSFTAVALAENPAESVLFQRLCGSFLLDKNVNSASTAELAAVQFSGSIA